MELGRTQDLIVACLPKRLAGSGVADEWYTSTTVYPVIIFPCHYHTHTEEADRKIQEIL